LGNDEFTLNKQEEKDPKSFSTFKERLHYLQVYDYPFPSLFSVNWFCKLTPFFFYSSRPKKVGFVLVDRGYMDGAFLHVGIFRKEKWYLLLLCCIHWIVCYFFLYRINCYFVLY